MSPRSTAAAGVIGGKLYVAGGGPAGGGSTNLLQEYNPATDTWTDKAPMPTSRAAAGSGVIGGKLYVVGGWLNSDSNSPTGALEVYDPATNAWTSAAPMPTQRGSVASAALGGKLYVTGGRGPCCSVQYATLEIYDPATDTWTMGAPLPTPREDPASAVLNGRLFVAGGDILVPGPAHVKTNVVEAYDPATDTWDTSTSAMPTARGHAAAGAISGTLHVVGGSSSTSGALALHETYDPLTNSWNSDDPMPTGRRMSVAGVVDGKLFVAGGANATGELGTNEVFTPAIVPLPPAPGVVVNTNDSGPGSLRAAIQYANSNPGADTISFAIPPTDPGFNGQWFTIRPLSALPPLTDGGTTIDGFTQQTFGGDTNPAGPEIELNGASAGPAMGLLANSSGNVINALAVNGFQSAGGGTGLGIQLRLSGNVVTASYLGVDPTGTTAVPNGEAGISIGHDATANRVGGPAGSDRNVISGNHDYGVIILADGTDTVVEGNYIGTNASGTATIANGTVGGPDGGMHVQGSYNTIRGNVISGNNGAGIGMFLSSSQGNVVRGNSIGTNAAGTAAIPNNGSGLSIAGSSNTIGGPSVAERNVISGNTQNGVTISGGATNNTLQGNYVGTTATGTAKLGNGGNGILLAGASNTTIGGATEGARNVISGNGNAGIRFSFGTGNTVRGNYIGVDASGSAPLGNALSGVVIAAFGPAPSEDNVVAGNVISANGTPGAGLSGVGVLIVGPNARANRVQGNWIGTDASGARQLGNDLGGVGFHSGSHDNLIGGAEAGAGNVIAFNGDEGVGVNILAGPPVRNRISRNSIFSNFGLGIDLGGDGVTPNDPGDADTGPNELMNYPVFDKAKAKKKAAAIDGTIDTPNPETVVIEIFANTTGDPSGFGEGETFLGAVTPNPDGTFSFDLPPVPAGTIITATATDAAGNTSEFSEGIPAK